MFVLCILSIKFLYNINSRNPLFMENVEVKQEIKNSDDGKGILITNDAIEQISNLLKGQSDKKALRVGVRSVVVV